MQCVVLCAGKGLRMGNASPKVLLPINGLPLLWHVIRMWTSSVSEFIFVVGYRWTEVIKVLPEDSIYTFQDSQRGIANALLQVEPLVNGNFLVALGDCIQKGEWQIPPYPPSLGIGVWETDNLDAIKSSYSVEISDNCVSRVIEKPTGIINNYCGMGTYFFDRRVFDYIRKTSISSLRNEIEITDTLQLMVNSGEKITPIFFKGEYLNITHPEDIKKAEEILS